MTTTLIREKFTDRGDQCWAVKSAEGAAEFRVITSTSTPVAITLHSASRRGAGWSNEDCDLLPGGKCWADCSFAAGRDLYDAWLRGNRDDEVIWGALKDWHGCHFGAEPGSPVSTGTPDQAAACPYLEVAGPGSLPLEAHAHP